MWCNFIRDLNIPLKEIKQLKEINSIKKAILYIILLIIVYKFIKYGIENGLLSTF